MGARHLGHRDQTIRQPPYDARRVIERGLEERVIVGSQNDLLLGPDQPFDKIAIVEGEAIGVEGEYPRSLGKLGDRRQEKGVAGDREISCLTSAAEVDGLRQIVIGPESSDLDLPASRSIS
jgi:hypothetical protein